MKQTIVYHPFLQGGGAMGALARGLDWSQTPVGPPDCWPQSLRTMVAFVLRSADPSLLYWGRSLTCFYNDAFHNLPGPLCKPALGRPAALAWPEHWAAAGPYINAVFNKGEPVYFTGRPAPAEECADGEDVYLLYACTPVLDESGAVAGVLATCAETALQVRTVQEYHKDKQNDREIAKRALEESEAKFRSLIQDAPVATCLFVGRELKIELANSKMIELWGKGPAVVGLPLAEALPELKDQPFLPQLDALFTTGKIHEEKGAQANLVIDGKLNTFYFDYTNKPLRNAGGEVYAILEMAIDVTAQAIARKQLEESEANLRNIILQAPVAMCIFRGPQHVVEIANEKMLEFWEKSKEDMLNKPVFEAIREGKEQGFEEILDKVYTTGETMKAYGVPVSLPRNGKMEVIFANYVFEAYKEPDGSISGIMAVANEVTQQVKAIQLIELAEERARLAIHSAELGLYEVNIATGTINADARFYEIFGSDPSGDWEEAFSSIHPEDRVIRERGLQAALNTGQLNYQARIVRKDRSVHWIKAVGKILFDKDGRAIKLTGVAQDITEQKRFAEELEIKVAERTKELALANKQLQQSNAELNQFAYIASHDLQEPLRKVRTYAGMLCSTLADTLPKTKEYLQRIESSTTRMQNLINDVLDFSRLAQQTARFEQVDLNKVLQAIIEDYELLIEQSGATITLHPLPVIEANFLQMTQLFTNLISNALKFRNTERKLEISLCSGKLPESEIGMHAELLENEAYHALQFTDNGIGFDQLYAERIFIIFQRLHGKAAYDGTGIGLAMCKKIVLNHRGLIYAASGAGQGATFTIVLPERQNKVQ